MAKKKPVNSRAKGARGELELSAYLADKGFTARRGQQFSGGTESPDVVCPGLADYHLEVKRTEKAMVYPWMAQAIRDAGTKVPVVVHRQSNQDWVAIVRLEDLLALILVTGL